MANLSLENVSKRFPGADKNAVDQVSLEIEDREFFVLVGPSGCGKSTTLRLIAGLETNASGEVKIGNDVVNHVAPKDRNIAMVFQNFALYPQMSVYENLKFGLSLRSGIGIFGGGVLARGLRKIFRPQRAAELAQLQHEIDIKVRRAAESLGIENLLKRRSHQLSGGERQRVALGRAIVRNPAAFLLDEPLSNLDANLRLQMRRELKQLHSDLQATMIYVTHDQVEAMALGDRIAVMNEGRVLQVGTPLEVYQQPANLFVATFVGNVPMNCCRGTVMQTDEAIGFEHRCGDVEIRWTAGMPGFEAAKNSLNRAGVTSGSKQNVVLGFRAHDVKVMGQTAALSDSLGGSLSVRLTQVDRLGECTMLAASVGNDDNLESENRADSEILVRHEADTSLQVGDEVKLIVDLQRVVWFDPETGKNLVKDN